MAIDPKIVEAIEESAQKAGQSLALARRLVAWFDAIASGNEDINDRQSAYRHLELLYEETQTGAAPRDDEGEDNTDESASDEEQD